MKKILQLLTFQIPGSFTAFVAIVTFVLLVIPYQFLNENKLSLYERLNIPSPSIGLTRAYWKLIRLDVAGAWARNKLIFPVVIIVFLLVIKDIKSILKRFTRSKTNSI